MFPYKPCEDTLFCEAFPDAQQNQSLFVLLSFVFYTCTYVAQLCLTLCDPMGYSFLGSPVHGIL